MRTRPRAHWQGPLYLIISRKILKTNEVISINTAIKFRFNLEIFGEDINCNLSDIADKLLYCLYDHTKKAFYVVSPEELHRILTEFCACVGCTESGCIESVKYSTSQPSMLPGNNTVECYNVGKTAGISVSIVAVEIGAFLGLGGILFKIYKKLYGKSKSINLKYGTDIEEIESFQPYTNTISIETAQDIALPEMTSGTNNSSRINPGQSLATNAVVKMTRVSFENNQANI